MRSLRDDAGGAEVDVSPIRRFDNRAAARSLGLLNPRRLYHRAEISFAERIPANGGAVIVGNHGRLDFDSYILANLILRSRGRLVRLMADHLWSRVPGYRRLMTSAGAVDGTPANAMDLLDRGELILTYPGGVREIMGSRFGHEHIDWSRRNGFARIALAAGVPVVPVLGVGVNNGFIFVSGGRLLGRLLFQWLLRLGPAYKDYRDPLTVGLIPIPLPFSLAVNFPWPCKVRYVVGEPVHPAITADRRSAGGIEEEAVEFAERVATAMQALIEQYGRS